MTNYWLLGTTQTNFCIAKNRKFDIECFHDPYENQVKKVKLDDGLVYYIWGLRKFGAITKAINTYFYDDKTKIFDGLPNNPNEIYPHRFETRPILVPVNNESLNAEKLVPRLSIISDKQKAYSWTLAFRRSLRRIGQEDFELIQTEMRKSGLFKEIEPL